MLFGLRHPPDLASHSVPIATHHRTALYIPANIDPARSVTLSANLLTTPGAYTLTIFNSTPGGCESSGLTFAVEPSVSYNLYKLLYTIITLK